MENSKIEWTDHTFNPWHGCLKVSEGCKNCYAETLDNRWNGGHWGPNSPRKPMSEAYWNKPLHWDKAAASAGIKAKVFSASMADVFEDHPDVVEWRKRLFRLIDSTPNLIWLLLTKRPENILRLAPDYWGRDFWPDNLWIGTSVENQAAADERIPHLLSVPAAVRFLSCEPLLGPVEFSDVTKRSDFKSVLGKPALQGIDWVIVGGESGHRARPMHPYWARSLRDQCKAAGVPFFFKQWGEYRPYYTNPITEPIPLDVFGCKKKIFRSGHFFDMPGEMAVNEALDDFISFKVGKSAAGSLLDRKEHKEFPEII